MPGPQSDFNPSARPPLGWRLLRGVGAIGLLSCLGAFTAIAGSNNPDLPSLFALVCGLPACAGIYMLADDSIKQARRNSSPTHS